MYSLMPVYGGTTELRTRLQRQPNLPVPPVEEDQVLSYLRTLDRAIVDFYGRLAERLQSFVEVTDTTPFGAADTAVAVTFGTDLADSDYVVLVTPSWNTKIWVTSVVTSGFTIHASDAPGGAGGDARWVVIR